MKFLKSFLLMLHTQILINVLFVLVYHFNLPKFARFDSPVKNLAMFSGILMGLYFVIALGFGLFKPKVLDYPFKSGFMMLLLFGTYTISFAMAQKDLVYWTLYALTHFPVGWFLKSVLASEFTLVFQFALMIPVLTAVLAQIMGYGLSQQIHRLLKRSK